MINFIVVSQDSSCSYQIYFNTETSKDALKLIYCI